MRLYQYTSIDALALILNSKKLRFSRLDKVDDIEESEMISGGINLSYYTYVSCWTNSSEENIALWKMYTSDERGVILSLDSNMFKKHLLKKGECNHLMEVVGNDTYVFCPKEDAFSDQYIIFEINFNPNLEPYNVVYDKDVAKLKKSLVFRDVDGKITMNLKEAGIYKHDRWKFQEEVRFVIHLFPCDLSLINKGVYPAQYLVDCLDSQKHCNIDYFYLELDQDVLNTAELILNPMITESNRIIVESLRDKYVPGAIVRNSMLTGLIRK